MNELINTYYKLISRTLGIKYSELRLFLNINGLAVGIIGVIIFIASIVFVVGIPHRNRIAKQEDLKGITFGSITNISSNKGYVQGLDGSSEITVSNRVCYTFMVDDKYYNNVDFIKNSSDICYTDRGYVIIKFRIGRPEISLIKLKK